MSTWGLPLCFCILQTFLQLGCRYGVWSEEEEVGCVAWSQAAHPEHPSVGKWGLQSRGSQPAGRERASSLGSSSRGDAVSPSPCFLQT